MTIITHNRSAARLGGAALIVAALGFIGVFTMWRNVTTAVAPAAALNNAVLPIWMLAFGAGLMTIRKD